MRRHPFILIICIAVFFGCKSEKDARENAFIIKGKLENAEKIKISLDELTPQDLVPFDTIYTGENGEFVYRNKISDASFYILKTNQHNSITLLVEPGEVIEIHGNADDLLADCKVSGSKGTKLMLNLNRKLDNSYKKIDSLAEVFKESRFMPDFDDIRNAINVEYAQIFDEHRDFLKGFIKENSKSLASIIALNQYLGDRMLLTMGNNLDYFKDLSSSLSQVYASNRHVIDLKKQISNYKRRMIQRQMAEEQLAIGNTAPEIVMNNLDGEPIALSSLRGNFVLIDFWASWCSKCRQNNESYKHTYNSFNHVGFEIYGVSLDRKREEWLNSIKIDGISWLQVNDFRFWHSPVVALYNVEGIPHNVLVDKNGKIVARDLSPEDVHAFLKENLH